jgi:hypothetical protein
VERYADDRGMLSEELNTLVTNNVRTNRQATKSGEGDVKFLKGISKTGQDVMGILQASAGEQQAHADTMAAEALSRRTTSDQTLIAQQHHDIAMMKLQARLDRQAIEQQMEDQRKALGDQTFATMKPHIAAIESMIPTITSMEGESTREEIVNALMSGDFGLAEEDRPFVEKLVLQLTSNTQPGDDDAKIAAEVLDVLNDLPEWSNLTGKNRDKMKELLARRFSVAKVNALIAAEAPDPEAQPGPADQGARPSAWDNFLRGIRGDEDTNSPWDNFMNGLRGFTD